MRVSSDAPACSFSAYPKAEKVLGWVQGPPGLPEGSCVVTVSGDCLEPLIRDGEKVAVEPTRPRAGNIVCLIGRTLANGLIKRLRQDFFGSIPFNPASELSPVICVEQINPHRVYQIDGSRLLDVHRVSWVLRDGEWQSVYSLAAALTGEEVRHA